MTILARLEAYSNLEEDLQIVRLPRDWALGTHFEPNLKAVVLHSTSQGQQEIVFEQTGRVSWAHRSIDLDGRNGCSLGCWVEFTTRVSKSTLAELLNPDISKTFRIELVHPGTTDPLQRELYSILTNPDILVQKQPNRARVSKPRSKSNET